MKQWYVLYCGFAVLVTVILLCMFIHKCEEVRKLQSLLDARTEVVDEQNRIIAKLLDLRGTDGNKCY